MRTLVITALLFAAGCSPQAPAGETTAAESATTVAVDAGPNNCPANATSTWQGFTVSASAAGADCVHARATITFTGANGAVAYTETLEAEHVMVLANAESPADMQRMLTEWVNPPGAAMNSTGDLPEWPANAQQTSGEFPFYPEEGTDRAAYEALRRTDSPMFCYVQGMESLGCVIGDNGVITKIGVQSFPG